MKKVQWIIGGRVVLPDQTMEAHIKIEDGRIAAIYGSEELSPNELHGGNNRGEAAEIIDAEGCYILPGLIDLHCDAIEKEVQPRPNTLFPLQMALLEFERKLPLHGITSMYHSLSLGVGLSVRGEHLVTDMIEQIHAYKKQRSVIRNRIHLRYEVSHLTGISLVERFIEEDRIDLLSFMDHSPGQGQYREPGSFERYVMKNQGVDVYEVQQMVKELNERREQVNWQELKQLAGIAVKKGIAIASHDDDTVERVNQSKALGCTISEFPINLASARQAIAEHMYVCVGAPNIVRGGSHDKNMRAADAVAAGAANILCSDYHPAALLLAVFMLADEKVVPLHEAVRMATLYPARALGIADRLGSICTGCAADLILVDRFAGHPWVVRTIVGGSTVYQADVRK